MLLLSFHFLLSLHVERKKKDLHRGVMAFCPGRHDRELRKTTTKQKALFIYPPVSRLIKRLNCFQILNQMFIFNIK